MKHTTNIWSVAYLEKAKCKANSEDRKPNKGSRRSIIFKLALENKKIEEIDAFKFVSVYTITFLEEYKKKVDK